MENINSFAVTWTAAGVTTASTDMGASVNSNPTPVNRFRIFSFNSTWTTANTPVGTIDVQVCNAPVNSPTLTGDETANWVTLTSLQLQVPGTSPGLQHIQVAGFSWARLKFTRVSGGSGDTLSAQLQGFAE